ncbi:hypothetical protein GCM10009844_00680 [Nocardioides koreensis]|uniref:Uncharacterized protein n=1 Tax=Nocardioides koreensis TaxID=433651 RepID=A0ABN2Z1L9_9ACTN
MRQRFVVMPFGFHLVRVAHENSDVDKKLLLRMLVATNPDASADHIVAVFEHLGPDYNKIRQTGKELKFNRDDTHDRLLRILDTANRVTCGYPKGLYSATVS